MVKKTIVIISLFVLLIAGAICEEIYLSTSINELAQKTKQIEYYMNNDFDYTNALKQTKNLELYWQEREQVLCLIINYKEIKDIILQIKRLKQSLEQNQKEDAFMELETLKLTTDNCSNIIGFNIQNVL